MRAKTVFLFAALSVFAACGPEARQAETQSAAPACAALASTEWAASTKTKLAISARYDGADCTSAEAALTIANGAGKQVYSFSLPVEIARNTIFAEADNAERMRAALADWIDPAGNTTMRTTSALPEWRTGEQEPGNAEFPFMPEVSREDYAKLRKENRPLYCHVQGGESMACLTWDDAAGALVKVGLQRFPG